MSPPSLIQQTCNQWLKLELTLRNNPSRVAILCCISVILFAHISKSTFKTHFGILWPTDKCTGEWVTMDHWPGLRIGYDAFWNKLQKVIIMSGMRHPPESKNNPLTKLYLINKRDRNILLVINCLSKIGSLTLSIAGQWHQQILTQNHSVFLILISFSSLHLTD